MYTGTFNLMPADKNWIYDPTQNPYNKCPAHHQFEANLVSWRLEISEVEFTYDYTANVMIIDRQTLPWYFAEGFCKPTTKTLFILVWFNDFFTLQDFLGRMTKIEDRYWIETDSFVHSPHPVKPKTSFGIKGTEHPYVSAPHTQHPNNPSLSRFDVHPTAQTFCGKPDQLYSTQYSDLFVTYTDGFNMHTRQPNPRSMIDEKIFGKIVLDNSNNTFVFPALNVSNSFATFDYDAHINTKIEYTINHVFRSSVNQVLKPVYMSEQRLNASKLLNVLLMQRKICFQGSVKYRRVDRTVWNHNTLPLLVTLDPLECKNIIRHLNGRNDKILNNLHYNKTFTLLEDHYFQEQLEQYQIPFTVYQLNKMYTGTFTFMPADKNWIYDPTQNPYHNCPAHHQFEVILVSWRLEISEV